MSDPTPPSAPEPESPAAVPPTPDATPAAVAPTDGQPVPPPAAPPAPPAGMPPVYAPGAPQPTAAPATAPAYAPPAGYAAVPQADTRPKTLAVIALALAAVGLVLAFIPFVTWFSGILLLAGFVVGLVALIGKKHGGKGFSIAAVIVSVVGWIVSIVMSIASFGILGQSALEESVREDTSSSSSSDTEDDTEAATDDEPAADERQDLVLVESAFGRTSYDPTTWWYVIVIDNPNEDHIFDATSIDVEALDAAGTILDSSSEYRTILSGRTAISGTFLSIGDGEISTLDVLGPEATDAIRSPLDETGTFTIEGVTPTTDSFSTTVRGNVRADFESDQELVQVVVVARNAAGAIIGAEWAYIDRLPAGGTAQFEAMFLDTLPADTVYEAYAAL